MTRLLLTKIPMFKEVVVSSFQCPHCGASNSSIQSGAAIEDRGVKYTFRVQEIEVYTCVHDICYNYIMCMNICDRPREKGPFDAQIFFMWVCS